jgi:hypothetical protein
MKSVRLGHPLPRPACALQQRWEVCGWRARPPTDVKPQATRPLIDCSNHDRSNVGTRDGVAAHQCVVVADHEFLGAAWQVISKAARLDDREAHTGRLQEGLCLKLVEQSLASPNGSRVQSGVHGCNKYHGGCARCALYRVCEFNASIGDRDGAPPPGFGGRMSDGASTW